MARRSRDWNLGLAQDLKDAAFAREFLVAAMEEGASLPEALGKVIRTMGVAEFALKARMPAPNVLRAIGPQHNPTAATLGRLLKPFGLKLGVIRTAARRRAA
jgi:DNA-binding phage protein